MGKALAEVERFVMPVHKSPERHCYKFRLFADPEYVDRFPKRRVACADSPEEALSILAEINEIKFLEAVVWYFQGHIIFQRYNLSKPKPSLY